MAMRIDVVTLFPELFEVPLRTSIIGRAEDLGAVAFGIHDLREWGIGRHRSVDDYPYGGGAGMVLRPEPISAALQAVAPTGSSATRILLDPGGARFDQAMARDLAAKPHLVIVSPRYEGVDDRVRGL